MVEATPKNLAIQLESVSKWFGAFKVLNDIRLEVKVGERVVICGPSGSGKSTLIRCLNRLEHAQEGRMWVNGIDLMSDPRRADEVRAHVGMVFQQFNLFPHLSILDNCMLAPMQSKRLSRDSAREVAMHYLTRVRIPEQALKYPGQLSGGQQQRVAIARALCMSPKIMLFDEPTSSLDPEMVNEVLETMLELANDGMTMICVTHEMGFARSVADQIIFMAEGEIVERATPQTFFESPIDPRTRQFLSKLLHHT